jgi:hypothetical protein
MIRDDPAKLERSYQLAMVGAVERVASDPARRLLGAMAVLTSPEDGITIAVDWPKFLRCTERDILDALVGARVPGDRPSHTGGQIM